jgi:hypothetical protein
MTSCIKTLVIALAITSLSACIDVEDNNDNSELVSAIQQQNDILNAQNDLLQIEDNNSELVSVIQQQNDILTEQNNVLNAQHSVTLTGNIKNISINTVAKNASVAIKVGNNWSEPVDLDEDGSFKINDLPFNSDFTLVVKSNDQAFLSRIYHGVTTYGTTGVIYQHIGEVAVSEGELRSFSIMDSVTQKSVLGLNIYSNSFIKANNRLNNISVVEEYIHKSSYNETTEQYEIMLPKDIPLDLLGSLDVNNDGKDDYLLENVYYNSNPNDKVLVSAQLIDDTDFLYLVNKTPVLQNIELRISVIDRESMVLEELTLLIDDDENGEIISEFDDTNKQYVLNTLLKDEVYVYLPAFNQDTKKFDSSTLKISKYDDNRIRVSTPVYSSNDYHTNKSYYLPSNSTSLNIVMQPKLNTNPETEIKLVTKSSNLNADNQSFKVFYSQSIELTQSSVELKQKDVLSVIKGNTLTDDLVLPGTTIISNVDKTLNTNTQLSLNNTLLTVTPESSLETGFAYEYIINEVIESDSKELVNINNDNLTFSIEEQSDATFDITSLKLDNNNYYTNGELIKEENTADEASNSISNNYGDARIIIPPSAMASLKSLSLQKKVVTKNNIAINEQMFWQIINNGQSNLSTYYAVSAAQNENLVFDNISRYSILLGSAYPDGKIYNINTYEDLKDNTDITENSITFLYTYQTLSGEISTGEIKLAVQ